MTKAYRAMQEGIRDEDPEKGTEERKKRLEKKRGMKMDDHPQYAKEALDPVGKEDGDVNNDGKKDDTDSYLMKRRKAIGSAMKKRLKEERASLSEVMTDKEDEKKVVEKRINNKVTINPKLSEAVEEMGGEVLEMVEVDENLDEGMGLGLAAGAAALAAAPYLAKKFLKPKVDKALDKQRKTAPIGGDRRVPQMNSVEVDGDMVQEAGGPALPGEPGRPGTPKAPGGRPHLPGEKQTPKPKKAGMLRLAHTEYSDWRSDLQEGPYVVTNADKKGNTPAYQGLKAGKLNAKTGKPLYVAAPHLKLADSHELEGEDLQELEDTSGYKLRPMGRNNPAANKPTPRINPNRSFSGRGAGRAAFRDSNVPAGSGIKQSGGGANQGATPKPTPKPSPKPAPKPQSTLSAKDQATNKEYDRLRSQPGGTKPGSAAEKFGKAAARAKFGDQKPKTPNPLMKRFKSKLGEENVIDERTRYAKETGKDPQTGKESKKGGTRDGKSAFDQVSREMRKTGGVMSSRGKGIQPQGKKKEKGKKGYKGVTPVDKIRNRLSQKRKEQPNPYRARAGESD